MPSGRNRWRPERDDGASFAASWLLLPAAATFDFLLGSSLSHRDQRSDPSRRLGDDSPHLDPWCPSVRTRTCLPPAPVLWREDLPCRVSLDFSFAIPCAAWTAPNDPEARMLPPRQRAPCRFRLGRSCLLPPQHPHVRAVIPRPLSSYRSRTPPVGSTSSSAHDRATCSSWHRPVDPSHPARPRRLSVTQHRSALLQGWYRSLASAERP